MKTVFIKYVCSSSIALFIVFYSFGRGIFDSFSYAISFTVFLSLLYEKWLWRIDVFNGIPKIYGTYEADNTSTYRGNTKYQSRVIIKQRFSQITVKEEIGDGTCNSIAASLYRSSEDGQWLLSYTYLTYPQNSHDDVHYGTSILSINQKKNTLTGQYYTNRIDQTKGGQVLTRISKKAWL